MVEWKGNQSFFQRLVDKKVFEQKNVRKKNKGNRLFDLFGFEDEYSF